MIANNNFNKEDRKKNSKKRDQCRQNERKQTLKSNDSNNMHSQIYIQEYDHEEDRIYDEWNCYYEKIIDAKNDEGHVCACCNSTICDFFDAISATNKMIKKNIETRTYDLESTFSCCGSEI